MILEMLKVSGLRSHIYTSLAILMANPANIAELEKPIETISNAMNELLELPFFRPTECLGFLLREEKEDKLKLMVEYTRLFVTAYPKVPCPPYESVYESEDRLLMRNSTLNVLDFYRKFGLSLADTFKEPPDHIATELEFMHFLTFKEAEAWRDDDKPKALQFLRAEADFTINHLSPWVPVLQKCVENHSEISFYRSTTCFLREFVEMDTSFIKWAAKNLADNSDST